MDTESSIIHWLTSQMAATAKIQPGRIQEQGTRNFWVTLICGDKQALYPPLISQAQYQGPGLEADQPVFSPALIWGCQHHRQRPHPPCQNVSPLCNLNKNKARVITVRIQDILQGSYNQNSLFLAQKQRCGSAKQIRNPRNQSTHLQPTLEKQAKMQLIRD